MNGNHFFPRKSAVIAIVICIAAFLQTSCTQDGFDDGERFTTVTGVQLLSPIADSIMVTPDATGSHQTISWPVVYGAGGYIVSLYNVNDPANPVVVDSMENVLVDATSIKVARQEDTFYKFVISSAENTVANNQAAKDASVKAYDTYVPTYRTIPSGTDLSTYFAAFAWPTDSQDVDLNFDLEAGGSYIMSDLVDFQLNKVTLRCTNKKNHPKVKFTGTNAGFAISAGFGLKNVDFNCSGSNIAFIGARATPLITNVVNGNYYLEDKVNIQSCKIDSVNSYFVYDNLTKTYIENVIVNNCVVNLTPSKTWDGVFYLNKGGNILNLAVSNSTFYRTGAFDYKYFYQTSGRAKNIGYASNTTGYTNCTFYNVCKDGQWGNYNGMAGQSNSYWTLTNDIFYNCSSSGVARRFLAGKRNQSTATFLNNTYAQNDGTIFDTPTGYDNTGTDIKEDPGFKDPANADFTISSTSKQASLGTGDPRWLPAAQ